MGFETFDLGRVFQTGEAIRGARRESENDIIRNRYLQNQDQRAQNADTRASQDQQMQMDAATAKVHYFQNHAIETASDPVAAAKQYSPDIVAQYDKAHGAGSFDKLAPEQVRGLATYAKSQAGALAGITPKVEWKDAGDKLIPVDEMGAPVQGMQPIAKSASPESQLSAETSRANNAASIATTQRGQDMSAATSRVNNEASVAATTRGQDMKVKNSKAANAQALSTTWATYEKAKQGLISGLEGSDTGPIAGRIPAVTAAQQTAEGAVSAMAPVLKQIFRVSGEGTFTDKDQELLLRMVPTRTDHPEARKAKLDNIDSIIRAKLGMSDAAAPAPGTVQDGYKFKGGNPADPHSWEPAQ